VNAAFLVNRLGIRFERRPTTSVAMQTVAVLLALAVSFLVSASLIHLAGADVAKAITLLFKGAFGSQKAVINSLVQATPLIFTGLATAIAFRARIWNIGQEAQVFAGAMMAYWATLHMAGLPRGIVLPATIFLGFLGGAILGGIVGLLREKFRVNEIISTVLSNYIVLYALSYLLSEPWRETGGYHQQSAKVTEASRYPAIEGLSPLHIGFLIAIAVTLGLYVLLAHTPLGFKIRAIGHNPRVAAFKGINVASMSILVLVLSGGIAGLAGSGELFGVTHRLRFDSLQGLGYTGIIIGVLGGLNPLGVLLAGMLFGCLLQGALYMKVLAGVPNAIASAMEAIILLFFLCSTVISRYRVRRLK